MDFKDRNVVSIREFEREEIQHILDVARGMLAIASGEEHSDLLNGYIMSSLFFEPSTRTRLSFEAAMHRLGGSVIGISGKEGSSLKKKETLADTIRMADSYSDVIVLRHPWEGSARLASTISTAPVINGGDGPGQHPTQTMLDLFTIEHEFGGIRDRVVTLVGDLKYGRTVHSLSYGLALMGAHVNLVAPPELQMPGEVIEHLGKLGVRPVVTVDLEEAARVSDVLYVTRIQEERFGDPTEYRKVAAAYQVTTRLLEHANANSIVMHPLPRVTEISVDVDQSPHARYFEQAFYGVPVRMALLALLLGAVQ